MLCHPALVPRHGRSDAQRKTFLSEQSISAVARTEAHDEAVFRKMRDVGILGIARPGDVFRAGGERRTDRVKTLHVSAGLRDLLINRPAHPRHDAHARDDVGAVGNLNPILRDRRPDRPHAERNHIERAAFHAVFKEAVHFRLHHVRGLPVVCRSGILFRLRADERALLDAGDVADVATDEDRVRAQLLIQPETGSRGHNEIAHRLVFSFRSVAPKDSVGFRQGGNFVHPGDDRCIVGFLASKWDCFAHKEVLEELILSDYHHAGKQNEFRLVRFFCQPILGES